MISTQRKPLFAGLNLECSLPARMCGNTLASSRGSLLSYLKEGSSFLVGGDTDGRNPFRTTFKPCLLVFAEQNINQGFLLWCMISSIYSRDKCSLHVLPGCPVALALLDTWRGQAFLSSNKPRRVCPQSLLINVTPV